MNVCVLLFAAYREAVGKPRLDVELPEGATVSDLYDALERAHPALHALRPYTSFAVNREFTESSTQLDGGDEVALLQPVSGGAA
jgi:molybdopterin synthase catalytic subunit